jgi:hypothetical protein
MVTGHDAQRAATDDVLPRHVIGWVKEHHGVGSDFIEKYAGHPHHVDRQRQRPIGLQGR